MNANQRDKNSSSVLLQQLMCTEETTKTILAFKSPRSYFYMNYFGGARDSHSYLAQNLSCDVGSY
jgi:hypothetical protein